MRIRSVVLTLILVACATGSPLREDGFVATAAGAGTWWVSFEAESMSAELARDNLLYNTARLILDKGGLYFTFQEAKPETRVERDQTGAVIDDPTLRDPTGETYSSTVSVQRVTTTSAVVELAKEPGPGVLEASKVMEEMTRKYSP